MEMIDKLRELNKKLDDPYFVKEFEEGFEKFLKERDMKIYHTATQQDYDALMSELEEKGCEWFDGKKPTAVNLWSMWKETTCLRVDNYVVFHGSLDYYREKYHNKNIIEYKAKGTKMKRELEEILHDVSVSVYWGLKDASTVESNLSEAKSSAKKLIEKIDEYFETLKPKFKVGDYVVEQNGDVISKINEVMNGRFFGSYYKRFDNYFYSDNCSIFPNNIERYATPKEIAEYEVALTFHKRGRKPFEVKEGDIISDSEAEKIFVDASDFWDKEDFTGGDYTLLKTVEEVNEWIKGE